MIVAGPVLVYLIFSGLVVAAILALGLPDAILVGYLVVAAVALVMLIRDLSARHAEVKPQPTEGEIEAREARRQRIGLVVLGVLVLSLVIGYLVFPANR